MNSLRLLREEKGLSQGALANKIELISIRPVLCDRKTIIRYEQGNFPEAVERFKAIADALGISMDELYNTQFVELTSKVREVK